VRHGSDGLAEFASRSRRLFIKSLDRIMLETRPGDQVRKLADKRNVFIIAMHDTYTRHIIDNQGII